MKVHDLVTADDKENGQVGSYEYLGTHMDNLLKWNVNIDILSKLVRRLHFLHQLRWSGLSTRLMTTFITTMILESLIKCGMTAWFVSLIVNCKSRLEKQVKTAMKIIGIKDPTLQSVFKGTVVNLAHSILMAFHIFCIQNMNYCLHGDDTDQHDHIICKE